MESNLTLTTNELEQWLEKRAIGEATLIPHHDAVKRL